MSITQRIATKLSVLPAQVEAAIQLLDTGSTVPFIARYRKEVTGLDEIQLRQLQEDLLYLRELEERRETILKSITQQDKLTPELKAEIIKAETKIRLEDLYRPYKPKRRTKGQIAIEAGLLGLADGLFEDPTLDPIPFAQSFVDPEKGVPDPEAALEGARYILMERLAEDPAVLAQIRTYLQEHILLQSQVITDKAEQAHKFKDYFEYSEPWSKVPSHRALALFRGQREGFLQLSLNLPEELEQPDQISTPIQMIARRFNITHQNRPADPWLQKMVMMTWRVKIHSHLSTELLTLLKEQAEEEAINVFKHNLRDLLMAPPGGPRTTLGLDPGLRTGVKVAVVDPTGKLLATDVIYPHVPHQKWKAALETLHQLILAHHVELISIGNGTASRETEKLVEDYLKQYPDKKLVKVVTSEAGASVYSASELAGKEFPNIDVSLRGAISIARRLQDPLAALVEIDPKSIGVGQYQHDVNQVKLSRSLDAVVEDAVNAVGVDVNTASFSLLTHVAGLNQQIAQNIIEYRQQHGPFPSRMHLMKVPRLGDKSFEQAAGFLRIMQGENPLDASCVHPEAYPVVETILNTVQRPLKEIMGNGDFLHTLKPQDFVTAQFGLPTIQDILKELEKPGRDPRESFKTAQFQEGVESLNDLRSGMVLEGVVTNVANFGAFVDIGVHQDGLVHISELSQQFVKDPRTVVKTGQIVKVTVLEVDKERKRISLSMRRQSDTAAPKPAAQATSPSKYPAKAKKASKEPLRDTSALGLALQAALKSKHDG